LLSQVEVLAILLSPNFQKKFGDVFNKKYLPWASKLYNDIILSFWNPDSHNLSYLQAWIWLLKSLMRCPFILQKVRLIDIDEIENSICKLRKYPSPLYYGIRPDLLNSVKTETKIVFEKM